MGQFQMKGILSTRPVRVPERREMAKVVNTWAT